jgi:hypothetical protein
MIDHNDPTRAQTDSISAPATDPSPTAQPTLPEQPLEVPTLTNSPGCVPAAVPRESDGLRGPRRARAVRVDAWAVPAAASWSRTRSTVRKISRQPRAKGWALPF